MLLGVCCRVSLLLPPSDWDAVEEGNGSDELSTALLPLAILIDRTVDADVVTCPDAELEVEVVSCDTVGLGVSCVLMAVIEVLSGVVVSFDKTSSSSTGTIGS